ncbi:HLA class II histocompatibility antigen gamma chain [Tiliqua scincoides]|uniref:HLA class II histocompatibility antigen gamma chain n=1 Tax=Tiliqua scincoides TaxID=71010 RepID=UPI003462C1C7
MEDDRNDLLSQQGIDGVSVGRPERRSCGRGVSYAGVSVLVGLLLAGQALTGYFVYQHNNQISKLTKNTQELQLKSLADSLPHNTKSSPKMKMSVMNVMPLAMSDIPNGQENLEDVTKLTNSTEDQVKRLLLRTNPTGKFPELKGSFMENMNHLKKLMTYEDWKAFETWMHKWLLFQMAQNKPKVIPAETVQTKCEAEASVKSPLLGRYRPQCDENGDYLAKQCHHSTGYCWCAYKNGTMIEGTKTRGHLDCTGKMETPDPENVTYSGLEFM